MSNLLPIQSGIPIPPVRRGSKARRRYNFEEMSVGDVMFVLGRDTKQFSAYVSRTTKNSPGRFETRDVLVKMVMGQWVLAEHGDPGAQQATGVWRVG